MNERIKEILKKEDELRMLHNMLILCQWSEEFQLISEKERTMIDSLRRQIKGAIETMDEIRKLIDI